MKIILQRSVDKLGTPGDVVVVSDGYARNFLIPRGLAIPASKGAVKHVESLKNAHLARTSKVREEQEAIAAKLAALSIKVVAQVGEEGKLFGSVTAADLAEELAKVSEGIEVDKRDVVLDEPIRSVGVHEFKVKLAHEVEAVCSVEVVAAE
jgi:large subunit ribosomal protein L9